MNSVLEVLFLRRPSIDYISCPVCDFDFSSSGGPVIVLDALGRLLAPSGFVLGGRGRFHLSWNHYPGALCYTVYKAVDSNNPNGEYVVVAECIEDPEIDLEPHGPGCYRVSAITENGETELSDPICGVGDGCPVILSGASPEFQSKPAGDSADITAEVGNSGEAEFFHWHKDGVFYRDTTGTSQSNLTISPLALSDSGFYTLVVGNSACQDESAPSQLEVTSVGMHDPIAYWKMDGLDATPNDEVAGYELAQSGGTPGTPGSTGKIIDAFNIAAVNDQNCSHDTALEPALGPTAAGAEVLVWLRFNTVVPAFATICTFTLGYALLTDTFDFASLSMLYDPLNDPGFLTVSFGTASVHFPFTHTIGLYQFFRLRYNAVTGKVGFALNGNPITESVGTHFLTGGPFLGGVGVGSNAGVNSTMDVSVDEIGIFDLAMSDVEAGDWYNSGAGRTYP